MGGKSASIIAGRPSDSENPTTLSSVQGPMYRLVPIVAALTVVMWSAVDAGRAQASASRERRTFAAALATIQKGMTEQQVLRVLGVPSTAHGRKRFIPRNTPRLGTRSAGRPILVLTTSDPRGSLATGYTRRLAESRAPAALVLSLRLVG